MSVSAIATEFLGRGGKRLRPRLCRAVFLLAGGGEGDAAIEGICEAVECFHKASLIHDDIQDCEEERYGRPSVWKEHGVAIAIAAGDWLVARGYGLIAEARAPDALALVRETVRSHAILCEGQGDDLEIAAARARGELSREEYLSVCERKTGEPFALAAALGALAAGADPAPYRRYGLDFGALFQVRDDIADGEAPRDAGEIASRLEERLRMTQVARALGDWHARRPREGGR